jgi:hypothetical protein
MALYDFATRRADAQNKFAAEQLAAEQGRLLGQQRFGRQRQETTRGFQQAFPRFTGQWARRLGSGIKSGVFGEGLQRNVSNFTQRMGDINAEEASMLGGFTASEAMRKAALEQLLNAIGEEETMYRMQNRMR